MTDIYEALVRLQYPKITLVNCKDVESAILVGENRTSLLVWLLQQSSHANLPSLDKFKGAVLEEELFKYYSQIGICKEKDKLLGNCSIKNQLSTLKLLLTFMKNVNANSKTADETKMSSIRNTLQHDYFENDINIISVDANISTKLNQAEANKYIEETRKNIDEIRSTKLDSDEELLKNNIQPSIEERLEKISEITNEKYAPALKNFTDAFKTMESLINGQNCPAQKLQNMNECVCRMYSDFSIVKQAISSKDEILNLTLPNSMRTIDTPLTETIEDNVLWIQRVFNTQTKEDAMDFFS